MPLDLCGDIPAGRDALCLTMVTYAEGDRVGLLLAALSLVPLAIVVALFTLSLAAGLDPGVQRTARWLFLGVWLNEGANLLLKHLIRQPRPIGGDKIDYGMPSSHAQFMMFMVALCDYLYQLQCLRIPRGIWRLSVLLVAMSVCYGRVHLGYHSWAQVVVGMVCGLLTGRLFCLLT